MALGYPAGEVTGNQGTESDLLHFTIEGPEGSDVVMLPIFTDEDVLRSALLRNPDWQELHVLTLDGGDLLEAVDPDVTVVMNPWSPFEYQLPPPN